MRFWLMLNIAMACVACLLGFVPDEGMSQNNCALSNLPPSVAENACTIKKEYAE